MLGSYLDLGNPVSADPLNAGLRAWYLPLPGQSYGTSLRNILGAAPAGNLLGGPTWGSAWPTGLPCLTQAAASTLRVEVPSSTILQPALVTLSVFCRQTAATLYQKLVHYSAINESIGYGMFLDFSTGNFVRWFVGDGSQKAAQAATALTPNKWTVVTGTFDGTTARLYLNGVEDATTPASITISYAGVQAFTIGNLPASITASQSFGGDIAGVRVLGRCYSPDEVYRESIEWQTGLPNLLARWNRRSYLFGASGSSPVSVGPLSPTTAADDGNGDYPWTIPGDAGSIGSNTADGSLPFQAISGHLLLTGYGFTLPVGATVDGIAVAITASTTSGTWQYDNVQLVIGGSRTGDNKSDGSNPAPGGSTLSVGGAADKWGLTPTRADINASNFGVAVQYGIGTLQSDEVFVTAATITVYYTAGGGVTVALTGSASTASAGTLAPSRAKALSGQSQTASPGTAGAAWSKTFTSQVLTPAAGTLSVTSAPVSVALTGSAATASAGTPAPAWSKAPTGQFGTASPGTASPGTARGASGQSQTAYAGTAAPSATKTPTGSAGTTSAGTTTAGAAYTLGGQSQTASRGTVSPGSAPALAGLPLGASGPTSAPCPAGQAREYTVTFPAGATGGYAALTGAAAFARDPSLDLAFDDPYPSWQIGYRGSLGAWSLALRFILEYRTPGSLSATRYANVGGTAPGGLLIGYTQDTGVTSCCDALSGFFLEENVGTGTPPDPPTVAPVGLCDGCGDLYPSDIAPGVGSAATGTAGTATPGLSYTLSGGSGSAAAGSVTYSGSVPLAGSAGVASPGTVAVSWALGLSGEAAALYPGTTAPGTTPTLSGLSSTPAAGTATPSESHGAELSGQFVTASAGTLSVTVTVSASGQAFTTEQGTVTPVNTQLIGVRFGYWAAPRPRAGSWTLPAVKSGKWSAA